MLKLVIKYLQNSNYSSKVVAFEQFYQSHPNYPSLLAITDGLSYLNIENIAANVVEKYVNKGSKLYVEGSLQTRKWTDKDGSEKYITEVVLQGFNSKIEIIENRKGESEAQEVNGNIVDGSFDPDIPF